MSMFILLQCNYLSLVFIVLTPHYEYVVNGVIGILISSSKTN